MYEAEGFAFETKEEAETARTEAEAIRYIKQQTKMDDPETILKLYNSLLEKKLFTTEVGLRFLFELQDYLQTIPFVKNEEIRPIPAHKAESVKKGKKAKKVKKETVKKESKQEKSRDGKSYKGAFQASLIISIALAVCIVGMFVITYVTGNTTNIVNYENQVLDRYSSWEEELNTREQDLNERQALIEEKEAKLGITGESADENQ